MTKAGVALLGIGILAAVVVWRAGAGPASAGPAPASASDVPIERVRELGRQAAAGDRFSAAAGVELSKIDRPSARPALREIALSPAPLASANALHALGNLRDPGDVPLFREIVKTRAGQRPWQEAVRGLGKVRASADLLPLLDAPSEQDRLAVLSALKDAAAPESAPALERFLARPGLTEPERVYAQLALRASR